MNITKDYFEHAVPAFETCGEEIFERMQSFLEDAAAELEAVAGPDWEKSVKDVTLVEDAAKMYVCCHAARTAIPQLDLVLTQNGFGVVNTNNVAPASRDRVNALTELLRRRESVNYDHFFRRLIRYTDWRNSPECGRLLSSLLWSATDCRFLGITYEGAAVYEEEFQKLKPAITAAESDLMKLMPAELYKKLAADAVLQELTYPYDMVRSMTLHYLQAHIMKMNVAGLESGLVTLLEDKAYSLLEYKDSSIYKANHVSHYENTKESKCHFWS